MTGRVLPLADLVKKAQGLPSAPRLLPKLMAQLADPESATEKVEELIKMDSGLSSGTLRLANSAFFHNEAGCDTITEAIVRLGFREIYRLATTKIASRWLTFPVRGYGWEPGDLYRHSLTVAVGTDLLAKQTGRVSPEIAYTAGLLHDVGKLALAYVSSEHFDKVRQLQAKERGSWRAAERKFFGYDHTDVAGALLQSWAFPSNLQQVVRFYPRPRDAAPEHRTLVAHVHAAKHIGLCLGTGVGEEGFQNEIDDAILTEEGLSRDMVQSLMPAVLDISTQLLRHESR